MRTHRFTFARGSIAALLILALSHAPAHAGWSSEPVRIVKTGSLIPLIKACSDGNYGTIVAWQEEAAASPRVLRAQHLLPTGDLDPAWPQDGAIVCGVDAARSGLFAISDHLGGAYFLWNEGSSLFATRIGGGGATAVAWPARGRQLGTTLNPPSVIDDGGTGFYAAWVGGADALIAIHLGPENTGVSGWPNASRIIGPATDHPTFGLWPRLSLAPDGGVFVAYGYWSVAPDSASAPGAYRLQRLTSAGLAASGWGAGIDLGSWHRELVYPDGGLLALCSDARGGVFVLVANTPDTGNYGDIVPLDFQTFRRQGDGRTALDWPDEGRTIVSSEYVDVGPNGSVGLVPDGSDGVYVGLLETYADQGSFLVFRDLSATGHWNYGRTISAIPYASCGVDILPAVGGGLFLVNVIPSGPSPYVRWDRYAAIGVARAPVTFGFGEWSEARYSPWEIWYGGVALASSGDGGVVFFWSQVRERYGLFARRFSPAGEVTAVEPSAPAALALQSLRFMRGSGVRASVSMPIAGSARFELFDVTGRKYASQSFACARGSNDLTLQGTASLPAGLFFARIVGNNHAFTGKVIVTR